MGANMKYSKILKYLNPMLIWRHSKGICPVCSHRTIFLFTKKLELIREHAVCIRCRSISRHRAMALCILNEYSTKGIRNLTDFRFSPDLRVLNTSHGSPLSKALGNAPNIYNTEYFDDCQTGHFKNGIMCQDLENLSFGSGTIDLVITEDVFEHVKDIEKAFSEVFRVLKKGGFHIFSIPFFFDNRTRHLFEKQGDKYIPIVFPIEYHGDIIRGRIPAYHYLGYDTFDLLNNIGFTTKIHFSQYPEYKKYATYNCYTFVSVKN